MKYYKTFTKIISFLLIVLIFSGCKYYRAYADTDVTEKDQKAVVRSLRNSDYHHFFLHSNDEVWELDYAYWNRDNLIYGNLIPVSSKLKSIYNSVPWDNGNSRWHDKIHQFKDIVAWTQTHMYIDEINETNLDNFSFKLSDINKVENLRYNKKRNALPIIGLTAAGLTTSMGVLLAIACNCPHTYTFDGESYHYTNTLFTGATAANLERNDYKVLQDYRSDSETYELYIKNEENESHYTNLLELLVVNHAENNQVIPDQNGKIHSISKLINATDVANERGDDLSSLISQKDGIGYLFDSESKDNLVSTYVTFDKPNDVSNAKVVLNIKNTKWGGIVYKTFATMMGDKYEGWVEKNQNRSNEEAIAGMHEAGIPLLLSIKQNDDWIDLENINLVGDVSYNSIVVPIDKELITNDIIELRLQAGFKFWDLDYVGMDFSKEKEIDVQIIKPSNTSDMDNDLTSLEFDDNHYLEHINKGDSTYLKFEGLNTSNEKRTIIMRSKGYYLSKEKYNGTPYWRELLKIKAPGGLSRFSRTLYEIHQQMAFE